jgi:uncharacterized membrane protein
MKFGLKKNKYKIYKDKYEKKSNYAMYWISFFLGIIYYFFKQLDFIAICDVDRDLLYLNMV